ncbi:MAG: thioredoxin domain-containing protein [Pseudomonadota bacterium]
MRKHPALYRRLIPRIAVAVLVAGIIGCSGAASTPGETRVKPLETLSAFDAAIGKTNGQNLVMVDFYADWCVPCRQLTPVIDALSVTYADRVDAYKVDVDKLNPVLERYGITAIPYVLFFKNGRPVKALPGLHPESAYRNAIRDLS